MSKSISVLGSTGSIGRQTLQVAEELGLHVTALTAGRQIDLLEQQARQFRPCLAAVYEESAARELRERLRGLPIEVMSGMEGLVAAAELAEADTVVTAVMGSVGLEPTLAAIRKKKRIALANKETLVCAGELVMAEAKKYGAEIVPVDSEHSAIFQCLLAAQGNKVEKIHLTASGGPFRTWERAKIAAATAGQALKHPNWDMGAKVTIDSATMMNKGFEVIEAKWLFDMDPDRINVVVHPESIIHSMVEFTDGAVIAQMGCPDMREPIGFALSFPERVSVGNRKLDFASLGQISFEAPDLKRFPCLELAYEAIRRGGNAPCALNAANEVTVAAYLKGLIGFYDIARINERCLNGLDFVAEPSLEDIFETNQEIASIADGYIV